MTPLQPVRTTANINANVNVVSNAANAGPVKSAAAPAASASTSAPVGAVRKCLPLALLPPGYAYDVNGRLRGPGGTVVPAEELRELARRARALRTQREASALQQLQQQAQNATASDKGWFSSWW